MLGASLDVKAALPLSKAGLMHMHVHQHGIGDCVEASTQRKPPGSLRKSCTDKVRGYGLEPIVWRGKRSIAEVAGLDRSSEIQGPCRLCTNRQRPNAGRLVRSLACFYVPRIRPLRGQVAFHATPSRQPTRYRWGARFLCRTCYCRQICTIVRIWSIGSHAENVAAWNAG